MKKIFSVMMLCLCCMAFVSCETKEEEYTGNKFKSAIFQAAPKFSEDILNLYDITVTYTAMDGTTKVMTPGEDGTIPFIDESTKLPATVKMVMKAVKKPTFDEYINSHETFDLETYLPRVEARYSTVAEGEKLLYREGSLEMLRVVRETVLIHLEDIYAQMNFTIEGTFTKTDSGCEFIKK